MSGINKVIILGNVGQDPEVSYLPAGTCFARISIATSEKWKDKQTGKPQERTTWHNIKFNGRLAEVVAKYVKKGSKLYLEGKNRCDKYQDAKTGQDKYAYYIAANEMQMLDSRQDSPQNNQAAYQQAPAPQQSQQAPQGSGGYQNQNPPQAPNGIDFNEDIPL